MFFFLSKVLSFLTTPLMIICVVLVAGWCLREGRSKKILIRTGIILLLFFSNGFIANEVFTLWEVPVTRFDAIQKHYAYGILLTGVTRPDATPHDRVYFQRGADRVTHTLQLYRAGIIRKILISGGSGRLMGSDVREADEMKSVLIMMGVPEADILTENESRNTRENAVNSVHILETLTKPDDCLLVTSAYHLRRARACFARLGWSMDVFATDFLTHDRQFNLEQLLVPRAEALVSWNILIKEWIGYLAYRLAGYI